MSANANDTGAAGTTGGGTSTTSTSSAAGTGGSASAGSSAAAGGKNSGSVVQTNSPADAPPDAPHSATPAFARPGEGRLQNIGAPATEQGGNAQTTASVGYPLRVMVHGHVHAGRAIKRGETIALDAAEYRWAIQNKIGEAGQRDAVGKPVDDDGNIIEAKQAEEIPLPKDQAIQPPQIIETDTQPVAEGADSGIK